MFSEKELDEAGIPREHHKTANILFESLVVASFLGLLAWAIF